jgi:circadian clock protein KaiC
LELHVVAPDNQNSANLLSTGITGLDDILGGGFFHNHLYLIEGDPGTGKTTIALQFLLEGARLGQKGLYVALFRIKSRASGNCRVARMVPRGRQYF